MSKDNWFSKITPAILAGVSNKDPGKGSVSVEDGLPFPNYPVDSHIHTPITTDVYGVGESLPGPKDK